MATGNYYSWLGQYEEDKNKPSDVINIYGNGDRAIADIVKKAVEDVNARSSRNGFFQKGR